MRGWARGLGEERREPVVAQKAAAGIQSGDAIAIGLEAWLHEANTEASWRRKEGSVAGEGSDPKIGLF